jgi:hypothetical protein
MLLQPRLVLAYRERPESPLRENVTARGKKLPG